MSRRPCQQSRQRRRNWPKPWPSCGRSIHPHSQKEQEAKGEELDQAWKTLVEAGPAGAAALKDEIKKIEAAKERDDHFKLGAAAILWQIGKASEAETIAAIWSGDVSLAGKANYYSYVFSPAFAAAQTHDPRIVPMLVAVLRDKQGRFEATAGDHTMQVEWPLTEVLIWGAFGSKGTPALRRVLAESKDETSRASAIVLLARAQDLASIEPIRRLAVHGSGAGRARPSKPWAFSAARRISISWPRVLKRPDPADACNFAYAIYEYGDLRAVPRLAALLSTDNERLGRRS